MVVIFGEMILNNCTSKFVAIYAKKRKTREKYCIKSTNLPLGLLASTLLSVFKNHPALTLWEFSLECRFINLTALA